MNLTNWLSRVYVGCWRKNRTTFALLETSEFDPTTDSAVNQLNLSRLPTASDVPSHAFTNFDGGAPARRAPGVRKRINVEVW
jgi:hypothetical protein